MRFQGKQAASCPSSNPIIEPAPAPPGPNIGKCHHELSRQHILAAVCRSVHTPWLPPPKSPTRAPRRTRHRPRPPRPTGRLRRVRVVLSATTKVVPSASTTTSTHVVCMRRRSLRSRVPSTKRSADSWRTAVRRCVCVGPRRSQPPHAVVAPPPTRTAPRQARSTEAHKRRPQHLAGPQSQAHGEHPPVADRYVYAVDRAEGPRPVCERTLIHPCSVLGGAPGGRGGGGGFFTLMTSAIYCWVIWGILHSCEMVMSASSACVWLFKSVFSSANGSPGSSS